MSNRKTILWLVRAREISLTLSQDFDILMEHIKYSP